MFNFEIVDASADRFHRRCYGVWPAVSCFTRRVNPGPFAVVYQSHNVDQSHDINGPLVMMPDGSIDKQFEM